MLSADNHYKLFVNEKLVSLGPARGDLQHSNYEPVDLTPFLRTGKNTIAAQVWNEGELRTEGHISLKTAFILQGTTERSKILNTDTSWKCTRDSIYFPVPVTMQNTYYVADPGELVKMAAQPKNWQSISFQDKEWKPAKVLSLASPKEIVGAFGMVDSWCLVKSTLPQMELTVQRLQQLRQVEGKEFIGRTDSIVSDGCKNQVLTTLNWRTYPYMQISITTKDTPLVLDDVYGTFTGYPFQAKAKLETDNAELTKMLEIGRRSTRSCAMETYMDCPFYEQLQYIGDSRIQALVSIYNFGDARLVRNALNQMNYSQQVEGFTASLHPSVDNFTPKDDFL